MDYVAEQEMEIESLEAIFQDDIEKYSGTVPDGWNPESIYKVTLTPTDEDGELERTMALEILFVLTETYPDEPPNVRLRSASGLSDDEVAEAQALIENEIQNNLGMAMMFNLFEVAKEWLRNRANVDDTYALTAEQKRKRIEEEEERKMAEQRSHGTPVTVETFLAWRAKFDVEMKEKANDAIRDDDPRNQRPTGKQLFMERPTCFDVKDDDDKDETNTNAEITDTEMDDDTDDEEWTSNYLETHGVN